MWTELLGRGLDCENVDWTVRMWTGWWG